MISIFQAVILGLVQGLTEFLPVSSSGHLLIIQKAMGIRETGFTFDVALHLGTLFALLIYFYKDILVIIRALFVKMDESKMAWLLVIATIPAAVIGFLLESAAESKFRSAALVSVNLAVFGLIMLLAEKYARRYKKPTNIKDISRNQALAMGFAQAAAVVPGVSRAGSTITAGLLAGLDRVSATKFSFLLGIPITGGAIAKVLIKQSAFSEIHSHFSVFVVGIVAAFAAGMFAIRFMLGYLGKHNLAVFAYYRMAFAAVVLSVLLLTR